MKILKAFVDFLSRADLMNLILVIVVASSFRCVIHNFVNYLLLPPISYLFKIDNINDLKYTYTDSKNNKLEIKYGRFIGSIFTFIIVAIAAFIVFRTLKLKKTKNFLR